MDDYNPKAAHDHETTTGTGASLWSRFKSRLLEPFRKGFITGSSYQRRWRLLQVEPTLMCNLRCIMCPWVDFRAALGKKAIMQPEVWDAIRPYLYDIESVDFTGGGEGLLQPRLAEWIGEAHDAGCTTGFLSNLLLLDEKRLSAMLDAGVDWIGVSFDGADREIYETVRRGSNFDTVTANIRRIAAMRKGKRPFTMLQFVIMDVNKHQIMDAVRLAARLGVDQINFKQCDVIRGEHGKDHGVFAHEETEEIARLTEVLERSRDLATSLGMNFADFNFLPRELPVCPQDPRSSMFVRSDGAVSPCINLSYGGESTFLGTPSFQPTVHYGRLPEDDLLDLWECETSRSYRDLFAERQESHLKAMEKAEQEGQDTDQARRTALAAMPQAAEGCRVCHYLYDT